MPIPDDTFDDAPERGSTEPRLLVELGGFEGPLDLLLDLARRQKVDLREISILALAEQYLAFIDAARRMRLELAADYLVMAAWLAFLKSRLLLPEPPKPEEPDARDLAAALALRLRRLEAVREAARRLEDRHRLGRDIFPRGAPEPQADGRPALYEASLYDLLAAYAAQRKRQAPAPVTLAPRRVWSLAEARAALERLVGSAGDWIDLHGYLLRYHPDPAMGRSILASCLSASLELVREGRAVLRQDGHFTPVMVKRGEPHLRAVTA